MIQAITSHPSAPSNQNSSALTFDRGLLHFASGSDVPEVILKMWDSAGPLKELPVKRRVSAERPCIDVTDPFDESSLYPLSVRI
jgi:hypothetical protein